MKYISQGFSVIPSNPKTKAPLIPWAEFQSRLASEDEITSWFKQYPKAMLSLVAGKQSGVTIIDCDSQAAIDRINETLPDSGEYPCTRTPKGGMHIITAYESSIPTKARILPDIDTRNDGGLAVIPPSIRHDGKGYTWLGVELSREALQPMPDSLVETLSQRHRQVCATSREHHKINNIYNNNTMGGPVWTSVDTSPLFSEGRRDNDLFTLANSLA